MQRKRARGVWFPLLGSGLLLGISVALPACSGKTGGDDASDGADDGDGSDGNGGGNSVPSGSDPGSVAMRRLNSTEYNNTVRDLLGTSLKPADEF